MIRWLLTCPLIIAAGCGSGELGVPEKVKCSYPGTKVVDRPGGRRRLVIYYHGLPPRLIKQDCIVGDGLTALVFHRPRGQVWHLAVGEGDCPVSIDYSDEASGVLSITHFTTDPREPFEKHVPFVAETVVITDEGIVKSDKAIVLKAEPGHSGRIEELTQMALESIRADNADSPESFASCLGHLRNIGVGLPDEVLAALDRLSPAADGAYAELIGRFSAEVNLIKDIKAVRRARSAAVEVNGRRHASGR